MVRQQWLPKTKQKITIKLHPSHSRIHGLLKDVRVAPTDFSATKIFAGKIKTNACILPAVQRGVLYMQSLEPILAHRLFSHIVTSEGKSPSNDLSSTKPGKALQPKQSCYTSILHLQLLPIPPQMLQIINFLTE